MLSCVLRTIPALSFLIASVSATLAQSVALPPTPEGLLDQVIVKYRSAKTYSDSGTCVHGLTWIGAKPSTEAFEIRFVRPVRLRFDLFRQMRVSDRSTRTVWWSDEQANRIWLSSSNRIKTLAANDLYRARWDVGAPAYFIPGLLNERYGHQQFLQVSRLTNPALLADESIEGIDCYHLVAKGNVAGNIEPADLWIGKNDLLIHKLATRWDAQWYEEVHRNIQIDAELSEDLFQVPER